MILVCGVVDEPVTERFLATLFVHDFPFTLLDPRQLGDPTRVELRIDGRGLSGRVNFGSWSLDLGDITGIFNRLRVGAERLSEAGEDEARTLRLLLDQFEGPVANRAKDMASNQVKACQYPAIERAGLHVPPTLIGGSLEQLRELSEQHGALIIKSSSSTRSIVKQVDARTWAKLASADTLPPHQVQAYIPGRNVRVHVVGSEVFACAFQTEATDYRFASLTGHDRHAAAIELPAEVARSCLALAQELGLSLAGIDLIEGSDARWYCLEVNTCPAYSWYEQQGRRAIGYSLASYLSRPFTNQHTREHGTHHVQR